MHAHIHIHIHVHVCMYAHVYIHVHPWDQCVGQFLLFHCFCKFTCYSVLASWSQFSFFLYWCIIIVCLINSYRRVGTCLKSLVFTRSLERNGCFQQHKMLLNLQKVVPAYCKCVPLCECSRWSWLSSYCDAWCMQLWCMLYFQIQEALELPPMLMVLHVDTG